MTMARFNRLACGLFIVALTAGAACRKEEPPKAPATPPAAKPAAKPADKPTAEPAAKPADKPTAEPAAKPAAKPTAALSPAVKAKLAEADAADGNTDKVVSKCLLCALRMDGKKEHTAEFGGYKLQFCSEECRNDFHADPEAKVLALQVEAP